VLGLFLATSGCGDDKGKQQSGKKETGATQTSAQTQTENPCESTLATIDEVFKLSRLERTTTVSDGVLRLNDWQRACGAADITLKSGIERLIKEEIPEVAEVLDTTDHSSGSNPYYSAGKA